MDLALGQVFYVAFQNFPTGLISFTCSNRWPDTISSGQSNHHLLRFNPWVGRIPWRKAWQPTPEFLPGESHRQRSLVGYSPWGHTESGTTWYAHIIRALPHLSHPLTPLPGILVSEAASGRFPVKIPSQMPGDTKKGSGCGTFPRREGVRPLSTQTPAWRSAAVTLPAVRFATGTAQTLHVASRSAVPRAWHPGPGGC